ncbi:MAG: hypothetical protein GXX96_23530 [Planctomycetaceae bacterium]|nr:hypothetical protein [Planctomycetaceae bacterium]
MPKRIHVSMTQAIEQPDAGSLIVKCGVEFDAEPSQGQDSDVHETDIAAALQVCRQILAEERTRHQQTHVAAR